MKNIAWSVKTVIKFISIVFLVIQSVVFLLHYSDKAELDYTGLIVFYLMQIIKNFDDYKNTEESKYKDLVWFFAMSTVIFTLAQFFI